MTLVWKLLRRHISFPQMAGFFLANLIGMLVVLLGLQFYNDVAPLFTQGDSFLRKDYLIASKRIGAVGALGGRADTFTPEETDALRRQRFCKAVGAFTASRYTVTAGMGIDGVAAFRTDMFFESVPDGFVDTDLSRWHFDEEAGVVPIILPRSYLSIYNFGFARSRSLPQLTEGLLAGLDLEVVMRGAGREGRVRGKVIGFSSRLNTILVPEDFMAWSNATFAPQADTAPTRLIVEVDNPADDAIVRYFQEHGYELEDDKLDAGRATYFLKVVAGIVMSVGLLISLLSFYILMLSVYLLVQKNTSKLENLLLIGYSPARVSLLYQLLTVALNGSVLVFALVLLTWARSLYLERIWTLFPQVEEGPTWPVWVLGIGLFVGVSAVNVMAVRRKVYSIWCRKE